MEWQVKLCDPSLTCVMHRRFRDEYCINYTKSSLLYKSLGQSHINQRALSSVHTSYTHCGNGGKAVHVFVSFLLIVLAATIAESAM